MCLNPLKSLINITEVDYFLKDSILVEITPVICIVFIDCEFVTFLKVDKFDQFSLVSLNLFIKI